MAARGEPLINARASSRPAHIPPNVIANRSFFIKKLIFGGDNWSNQGSGVEPISKASRGAQQWRHYVYSLRLGVHYYQQNEVFILLAHEKYNITFNAARTDTHNCFSGRFFPVFFKITAITQHIKAKKHGVHSLYCTYRY